MSQKSLWDPLAVYTSPRMVVLLLLGFASGLPLMLLGTPLQAWLTETGLSKIAIGATASALAIPYTFKFLWSPFLDRYVPPAPGRMAGSRRRGWLALTQVLLMLSIGLLGFQDPKSSGLFWVALAVAFLSASQDIAVDAYRTDILAEAEMGAGAAIFVNGYRIAVLTAAGLALFLADRIPWWQVYVLMAGLMGIGLVTAYFAPEPKGSDAPPPATLFAAVVEPFRSFWQRFPAIDAVKIPVLRKPQAFLTLLFIAAFQLADRLSGPLTTTFLLKIGFTKTDLGLRSPVILTATIIGVLVGGSVVQAVGIRSSLFGAGILLGLSNLSFMTLALVGQDYLVMYGATVVENFCAGLGTACFLAFLMSLCDKQYTATQYALFSSLFASSGIVAGFASGFLAQLGWPLFWGLSALATVPGLLLLSVMQPKADAGLDPQ